MATGGVTPEKAADFLLAVAVGIGSTLLDKQLLAEDRLEEPALWSMPFGKLEDVGA